MFFGSAAEGECLRLTGSSRCRRGPWEQPVPRHHSGEKTQQRRSQTHLSILALV